MTSFDAYVLDQQGFEAWFGAVLEEASRRDWRNLFHHPESKHRRWYEAGISPAEAALRHIREIE